MFFHWLPAFRTFRNRSICRNSFGYFRINVINHKSLEQAALNDQRLHFDAIKIDIWSNSFFVSHAIWLNIRNDLKSVLCRRSVSITQNPFFEFLSISQQPGNTNNNQQNDRNCSHKFSIVFRRKKTAKTHKTHLVSIHQSKR